MCISIGPEFKKKNIFLLYNLSVILHKRLCLCSIIADKCFTGRKDKKYPV